MMTAEDQRVFLQTLGQWVLEQIAQATAPLQERIAALESTGIKYVGTYQRAQNYSRGDVCTYEGSMWVCTCPTPPMEVPGKSVCWQLSVKSPRWPTPQRTQNSNVSTDRRPCT